MEAILIGLVLAGLAATKAFHAYEQWRIVGSVKEFGARVRYSDDGGRTYSAEDWHTLGKGGDYRREVVLHDQGSSPQRIYDITYSEPTKFAVSSGYMDVSFGL